MLRWITTALCVFCLAGAVLAADDAASQVASVPAFNPAKTKVLVLPFMATATTGTNRFAKGLEEGRAFVEQQFADHGFQIVSREEADKGCKECKYDPLDHENSIKKKNMAAVGRQVGAAIVASVVVQDFEDSANAVSFYVAIRIKALDVNSETYLVNQVEKAQNKRRSFKSAKSWMQNATKQCVKNGYEEWFKVYPVVKSGQQEASQTESTEDVAVETEAPAK
jgi:hypothetical protein